MPVVLVIDDDPKVLETMRRVLARSGYGVVQALSGQEALRRARQSGVDVIVADLRLPDIGGIDVLRQLRHDNVHTPMIVVTAYGTISSAVEAIKLGAVNYLEKPFARADLLQSISAALALPSGTVVLAPSSMPPAAHHPSSNWARLVLSALTASSDSNTLRAWGKCAGASAGTIKRRCAAMGLTAKQSRDFARLLRAFLQSHRFGLPVEVLLDTDPRTLQRLLQQAGPKVRGRGSDQVEEGARYEGPVTTVTRDTLEQFLKRQRFVTDRDALAAIQTLMPFAPEHPPVH